VLNANIKQESYGFSALSIDGIANLLRMDPGSGIVSKVIDEALQKKSLTKENFYQMLWENKVGDNDLGEYTEKVSTALLKAKEYFESVRKTQKGPLSTSLVIAYFLYQNQSNLYKSMWDSTLFLKMLVRNDLTTLASDNNYQQAVDAAYLFRDEFSPRISHNWIVDKFESGIIPKDSSLFLVRESDNLEEKVFMPINTDGVYYHCLNLMTWASVCMDPQIEKGLVIAYYNSEKFGGLDYKPQHGKEKVTADTLIALHANQIKRVVEENT